jgi:predicted RNA methylase
MSTTSGAEWKRDFGLDRSGPPTFFASKDELGPTTGSSGQRHVLRRAFELFDLDGVLCTESSPLIYFKEVARVDATRILQMHRRFWNHGGAPILVLIAPNEIQIHSGLRRPVALSDNDASPPSLVEVLDRASAAVREFLPAVESGEYFRKHPRSFNPEHRVDRSLLENLEATRRKLSEVSSRALDPAILDALLCRLVFTCYLFDRNVIGRNYLESSGIADATHLRDLLAIRPRSSATTHLYNLFRKLGEDFNGDLFNDDLDGEAVHISAGHIDLLDRFFSATDVEHGQQSFWPYDFGVIPIETISAIYERFLKPSDKNVGTFYTPRFLVELVLDATLTGTRSLLTQRVLDPACGSGIFLVGLFNRMAEEWTQINPDARNERRSRELMEVLTSNLFGVDINPTACRITAFSLYLAYLDQLSPRDIQDLQKKGRALPFLVNVVGSAISSQVGGNNVWCEDFFSEQVHFPNDANFVIGNPPWGSIATAGTSAGEWCAKRERPIPDKQMAAAFIWKAPEHAVADAKICFVLPYGILFNHSATAISFQKALFETHKVNRVVNLADFQQFLFEESRHPAIVIEYGKPPPSDRRSVIDYWTPKVDWAVARAEVINIGEDQRCPLTVQQILDDLQGEDGPWRAPQFAAIYK